MRASQLPPEDFGFQRYGSGEVLPAFGEKPARTAGRESGPSNFLFITCFGVMLLRSMGGGVAT